MLAHLLLGWKPDDFAFREITFTIICLASGRQNVSLVEDWRFVDDDAHGCANLTNSTDQEEEPEVVAHMGVGARLNDNPAGSAPQSSIYWFEGVLIYLVARLDKPDVIPQSVARVAQRARADCPWQPVDAVLISIAHVVLVRVFPCSTRNRFPSSTSVTNLPSTRENGFHHQSSRRGYSARKGLRRSELLEMRDGLGGGMTLTPLRMEAAIAQSGSGTLSARRILPGVYLPTFPTQST